MDDPLIYSQHNELPKLDIQNFLGKYQNLRKNCGNSTILDVGSGDGSATRMLGEFLGSFGKLIGIDRSEEMVEFAQRAHGDGKVEFRVGDVAVEEDLAEFSGEVDGVFSFFCLNWVQDQKAAWRNMFNVLKPSGQAAAILLSDSSLYHVYEVQSRNPKWSKFMDTIGQHITPYLHRENPEKILEKLLESCGFSVEICKAVDRSHTYPTEEILNRSIQAVSPFMKNMPENVHAEYLADFRKILKSLDSVKTHSEATEVSYQILHVIATKPR